MRLPMALVGDRDRDRAATSLRRHYLQGRLSADELAERTELALRARSDRDLRIALRDLPPPWRNFEDVVVPAARAASRAATRALVLLALMSFWSIASLVLLLAFVVALIVNGPSVSEVVGFPLVWVGLSYGLWRLWQHGGTRQA